MNAYLVLHVVGITEVLFLVLPSLCSCCTPHWDGSCGANCTGVAVENCFPDYGDSTLCLSVCCKTLSDAIGYVQQHHISSNVSVRVCSPSTVLETGPNNTVNNPRIETLVLESAERSVVQCSSREASIVFDGPSMSVTVQNIIFTGCSLNGTLHFENHHPIVRLQNLWFKMSGLSFVNVTGRVSIDNMNISDLNAPPTSSVATSGLYIFSRLLFKDEELSFNLTNCHFTNNTANNDNGTITMQGPTRGGGMLISLKRTRNNNSFFISNCKFTNNAAHLGGGLSVTVSSESEMKFEIRDSVFRGNVAQIGSAVDLYCSMGPVDKQSCLCVTVRDSEFNCNSPSGEVLQDNSATVSIKNVDLELNGRVTFHHNTGSAISSDNSDIYLNRDTAVSFTHNLAQQGAGLNLVSSFVHVYRNASVLFSNNRAIIAGGAIYSNQRQDIYVPYSHVCFIEYDDTDCGSADQNSLCSNPNNWNASFSFKDNHALDGRSIFTASVLPCMWKTSNESDIQEDLVATFCKWKSWHVRPNCTQGQVATPPHRFQMKRYELNQTVSGLPTTYSSLNLSVFDELGNNLTNRTIFTMLPSVRNNSLIIAPNYNGHIVVFGEGPRTEDWYIQTVGARTVTAAMTVHMIACPPGFRYDSKLNDCVCRKSLHAIVNCLPNKRALIQVANCISYLNDHNKEIVYGRCIFTSEKTANSSPFLNLPESDETVGQFCARLHRKGLLCGNCISGYSVDAFSDSFQCHKCSGSIFHWLIFIAVESIPIFLLFTTVVVLHISLTSGPVNGYIFCCQVITVTIEVIFTKTSLENTAVEHPYVMTNILLFPSNIWSLDFYRVYKIFDPKKPMCLGSNLTIMHLLALRYLTAFYPLLFLVVTCVLIELHARNCRCLVRLWNPVGYLVSRFRRRCDIRTSLVDAFATFILLSYVKIIRVSLLLTTYNTVHDMNSTVIMKVLHYDPTISYGSGEHIPFMAVGIFLLVTFGLFFPLLLILYQVRLLQKCLHLLKMNRNGLRIFMDAFQGCYKDGKDNGPDRRFFAGLYFVFRLLVFGTFNLFWTNKELYITLQSLMILFALVTAILRPYKRELYNIMDTIFFCVLGVAFGLHVYVFDKAETALKIPEGAVYAAYVLELIPFLYVICYMGLWVGRRVINHKQCKYGSLYTPIDNSISWRFNDTSEESNGLLAHSASVHNDDASIKCVLLSSSTSERRRSNTQSTSLVDTTSYGSIN